MSNPNNSLLDAFRTHYHRLKSALEEAHKGQTDSTVLQRLGDDLEEYWTLLSQVVHPFFLTPNDITQ